MRFQVYRDVAGEYRWRLRANNHRMIAQGESYKNREDCMHCIGLIRNLDPGTPVKDLTGGM